MSTDFICTQLQLVAEQLVAVSKARSLSRIVLSSPRGGQGKTMIAAELRPLLERLTFRPVHTIDRQEADTVDPLEFTRDEYVLVEASPLHGRDETIELLPPRWCEVADGAVVICPALETTRRDICRLGDRLRSLGIPPVGLIWTDHHLITPGRLRSRFLDIWRRGLRKVLRRSEEAVS